MKYLGPTQYSRLNEAVAVVFLATGLFLILSFASYQPFDPSWNTVTGSAKASNLTGPVGATLCDFFLQLMGLGAYALPLLSFLLGWRWLRSEAISSPTVKLIGAGVLVLSTCTLLGMLNWHPIASAIPAGGMLGAAFAEYLTSSLNTAGALLVTGASWVVSLYIVSKFEMSRLVNFLSVALRGPMALLGRISDRLIVWRQNRAMAAKQRAEQRALRRTLEANEAAQQAKEAAAEAAAPVAEAKPARRGSRRHLVPDSGPPPLPGYPPIVDPLAPLARAAAVGGPPPLPPSIQDIPIRELAPPEPEPFAPPADPELLAEHRAAKLGPPPKQRTNFRLPPTNLLQEPPERTAYDSQELKEIALRIKAKFEEFNVHGNVVQINPGPVVTTFEFKPEAGVKYSRITTLTEDLCLGLQAESILIERIPGKPTVGIEVPNSKREVISLRQILESEEFNDNPSSLTVALGKDINGRIKVAALDTMPHLLIAGSTGSGKSVMLNSLIMSILYKATPHQVRLIMVDPKRLEFGLYEGIPHLLTPVITDAKKATNALRNAVLEMERRLKLLASYGVRNIEQFNKKIRQLQAEPRSLFEEDSQVEELETLPYVLILIDELADLMMLERANVEESVTRLAQMARAVGMHLVLATQRPSVDVITGLIKANFPSRISFRVATRVDSRTVLDVMGAEHLLGKGDMLFLPPGSSRLVRVHGSYVSEAETNRVVEMWKQQAEPDYDKTFLLAPPADDESDEPEEFDGNEDPMYADAVRVVLEQGKASTSTLQRRLRLGYGRAARILDMMQREGIIGPPDGSRPREVLKRPDWLEEVASQLR